jgi:magnesium-transporting ATPase (P-type)
VVELHVGDRVPADVRLVKLKTATLRCEQASLTGESVAVQKSTEPLTDEDCELQVLTLEWLPLWRQPTNQQQQDCHHIWRLTCRFCAGTRSSSG